MTNRLVIKAVIIKQVLVTNLINVIYVNNYTR